jgi:hypothetical protein
VEKSVRLIADALSARLSAWRDSRSDAIEKADGSTPAIDLEIACSSACGEKAMSWTDLKGLAL